MSAQDKIRDVGDQRISAVSSKQSIPLKPEGMRKNGKLWHTSSSRKPFRPGHLPSSSQKPSSSSNNNNAFAKRQTLRQSALATKQLESELKAEKAAARKAHVDRILGRRKAKEEKERQRVLEEKMGFRRRERLRRKEKRNKLLNS